MIKLNHTPRPWRLNKNIIIVDGKDVEGGIFGGGRFIKEICSISIEGNTFIEAEANARLITVAPEMLEDEIKDFKLLFDVWDNGFDYDKHADLIESILLDKQKLIERATGKSIEKVLK